MKKLVIAVLLAVLIATAGCGAGQENSQQVNQEDVQKQDHVTIATKEESLENEFVKVELKVPEVTDMLNEEAKTKLNNQLMSIYDLKASLEDEAKQAAVDFEPQGIPFHTYELVADYNVSYNQKGILSLTTSIYSYTGGAHGGTGNISYNVDINSGETISLKSMFKDEVNYQELINEEIRKQIAQNPDIYFDGDMGFQTIADDQSFYIKEGTIVICFSEYEIAPYSSGSPEFEIQLDQFKDNLQPEYQEI
jgi:desulfoferrodoxin (superoxide reductase-like protein)